MLGEERCAGCGAMILGAELGCQAVWDEISIMIYTHPAYAASHDLAFDAYCMQHPEKYGRSAKSYAAHLTRLCCGIEYQADPGVYAIIRQWLDGKVPLEKPALLRERGQLTVLEVYAASDAAEFRQRVQAWAENVWQAYHSQHDLAHAWIKVAYAMDNQRGAHKAV